jgi:hypothetical protein
VDDLENVGGQCHNIRRHLKKEHFKTWADIVVLKKLKGWQGIHQHLKKGEPSREPFHLEGFHDKLIRWIAVDDQVSCVISMDTVILLPVLVIRCS